MRPIKEISNTRDINPAELNSANYQIVGITNAAQMLLDKEINDYRSLIDEVSLEDREGFYLNGTKIKEFNNLYGKVTLTCPVLRSKGFYPSFIEPWKRDSEEIDLLVFNSFMNGASTREIERLMSGFGISCSKSKVSRINKKFRSQLEDIENQDLSAKDYCIVSIDATYVSILSGDPDLKHYEKKPVFRALGLNSQTGYWELLSLKVYEHENATCYREFLNAIKERGLTHPVLFLRDLHKGLSKAVREVFPESFSQGCLFHLCQNVYKNLPRKVEEEIKEQIFNLVRQEDPKLRKKDLEELVKFYGKVYPKAVKTLLNNLEDCTAWTVLNCEFKTNNVNERNNQEDKRLIKAKGSFKSIESAESILTVNTQRYLSNTALKKPADLEKIQDMNRRFKAICYLSRKEIMDYFLDSKILDRPPAISTPMLWIDTIDIAYESFGQTRYVKILVCYGLKKGHRRRHFLWACPLFSSDFKDFERILLEIKNACKKEPEIIILPGDFPTLLRAMMNVFPDSLIQVDLISFSQMIADLLPAEYSKAFSSSFKCAFDHQDLTKEMLELIEKSLSHHHLEEAYKKFVSYKSCLLTFLDIGINYFNNFKSTGIFKKHITLKKEENEKNYSFFNRTLKAVQNYTWDIPCVYIDEIKILFERF